LRQNGELREGAQVAEITALLEFYDWPDGSRVIVRRERPHPGAQLSFTDVDGHRFQATLTDLAGSAVELERLHRGRANAEDRVRAAKQTGLENLPFREFALNAVWLELSMIAQDLGVWTQALCLDGELPTCEPKTLRYRLLHTAARLAFHARRATPAGQLALGQPARCRLRTSPGAPATRWLTPPQATTTTTSPRRQRPISAVAKHLPLPPHQPLRAPGNPWTPNPPPTTAVAAPDRGSTPPPPPLLHDRGLIVLC
ncbi:MAG TPA: transposase, partial [Candidatus Limnocylindria bacterium]|nr:transposase [Candidatus Limnocylindria bacterium]